MNAINNFTKTVEYASLISSSLILVDGMPSRSFSNQANAITNIFIGCMNLLNIDSLSIFTLANSVKQLTLGALLYARRNEVVSPFHEKTINSILGFDAFLQFSSTILILIRALIAEKILDREAALIFISFCIKSAAFVRFDLKNIYCKVP